MGAVTSSESTVKENRNGLLSLGFEPVRGDLYETVNLGKKKLKILGKDNKLGRLRYT